MARRAAGPRHRGERRRARRPLEPARLRDGRRRVDARRDRRGAGAAGRGARRVAGRRGARAVDVVRRPGPPRSRGAEPRRRRRRAACADRGARRRARSALGCSSSCPGSRRSIASWSTSTGSRAGAARPACRARGTSWPRTAATRRAPSASSSRPTRCTPTAAACTGRCRRGRSTCTSASTRRRRSSRFPRGVASSPCPPRREAGDAGRRRLARRGPGRLGPRRRRLHHLPGVAPRSGAAHVGARRRGALPRRVVRRRGRRARRSPVRRARRLGARARPRAGHGRGGAVEQRRGEGDARSSPTRRRSSAPATPARTSR